jgi:glyoxylase-like metal-dependent hydrolase (beta-lactamase superfamily II)
MYTIQALKCAEHVTSGAVFFFMSRFDEKVKVYLYFYLIKGNGKTIVVDTGLGDYEKRSQLQTVGAFDVGIEQDTTSCLKRFGVLPEDVDYLILTHLHNDHCGNAMLFKNAKIVISKKGWINTIAPKHRSLYPHPLYPRNVYEYLINKAWDRVILAADNFELLDGIKITWAGGHTVCSQMVWIDTNKGKAVITGDAIFLYENLESNIPIGLTTNIFESMDAMEQIRKADIVLTMHEPKVLERYPEGKVCQ